jgi:cytochrome P450
VVDAGASIAVAAEAVRVLHSHAGWLDPYPAYTTLRSVAPVYFDNSRQVYLVSRYRDVREVLFNPLLTVPDHHTHDRLIPDWRDHPAARWAFACLAFQPSDAHSRIRGVVNTFFTARRVETLSPQVQRLVDELLDAIEEPLRDGCVVDLQDTVGFRLPVAVIGALLGVPASDLAEFRWTFGDILHVMDTDIDAEVLRRADTAMHGVRTYFAELVESRRVCPRDDVLSAMLTTGDRLSTEELLSLVVLLFTGGFETTTLTIGTGTHALLTHVDQWRLVCADRALAVDVADEVLRWDCVLQRVTRVAADAIDVADVAIPAGSTVAALLGAANRDPEVYVLPDRFDVTRSGPRSMTFGGGPYGCLGYALARQELGIFFSELAARFPNIVLAGEPVRRPGSYLRGFDIVSVRLA